MTSPSPKRCVCCKKRRQIRPSIHEFCRKCSEDFLMCKVCVADDHENGVHVRFHHPHCVCRRRAAKRGKK
jgi:hypothetical protein